MSTTVHTKSGNCNSAYTKCHLQYPIKRLILLFIQRLLISIVQCNSFDCQMCIVLSTNAASDRAYRKFEYIQIDLTGAATNPWIRFEKD